MLKKVFSIILVVVWMCVIFFLSNEKSDVSTKKSNVVIDKTVLNIYRHTKNYNRDNERDVLKYSVTPIRKLAHFVEYFILGILVMNMLVNFGIDRNVIFYSTIYCLLYAVTDEIHQVFVAGRSAQVIDIIVDTFGGFAGSYVYVNMGNFGGKLSKKKE